MAEDFDDHRRVFNSCPKRVEGAAMIFKAPPQRLGTIVAKLLRIVANEVPACQFKTPNLSKHLFAIHRLEVFLLGLVRTGSKRHRLFDHFDISVSQADLIAGIDGGLCADRTSVTSNIMTMFESLSSSKRELGNVGVA